MPPTSGGVVPVLDLILDPDPNHHPESFALNGREVLEYSEIPTGLSDQEIYILRCVSLSLSVFTLTLITLVTYWFFRMRRSFRHDLIMLLIVSDGLEALFFMIFPIVDFAMGPIESASVFCQVSGFFLAVGIEASDIAVALIAIHTALYIFKPRQLSGQSGLYPYRRTAYTVFFTLPVILASLAFINSPAYVNNGQYCYLPIRPLWARLALSWIPRYTILLIIFVSYFCTYIYVSVLMHRFGEESRMRRHSVAPPTSSDQTTSNPSNQQDTTRSGSVPPTPPIAYHGLIPSTSDSHHSFSEEERQRRGSVSTEGSCEEPTYRPFATRSRVDSHHTGHGIRWKWPMFAADTSTADEERRESEAVEPHAGQQQQQQQQQRYQEQHNIHHHADVHAVHFPHTGNSVSYEPISSPQPARAADSSTRRYSLPVSSNANANTNSLASLSLAPNRRRASQQPAATPTTSPGSVWHRPSLAPFSPRRPHTASSSTGASSSIFLPPAATRTATSATGADPSGMAKARLKIRRQLRLLFVYPLVYMLVWAVPFAQHVVRWNEPTQAGPFALVLASLISLCTQGAADAVLFACREKPWRHSGGKHSGQAQAQAQRKVRGRRGWTWWGTREGEGPGRTREEMLFDGRNARVRREMESVENRTRRGAPRTETEWWEWLDRVGMEGESGDRDLEREREEARDMVFELRGRK
ncbi:hypothetical protein ACHAQA_007146 [Verticillium albo-atrum]